MNHRSVHCLTQIGSGTYGRVYTAKRVDNGETVVVKQVSLAGLTPEMQLKTLDEARVMAAVDHPNIIKYFGTDIFEGSLEIYMEYAPSGDLSGIIRRAKSNHEMISERKIWVYFFQIALGLQHMHKRRIMHRDIKPQNIFLDADGNVKIGDCGLARMLGPQSMYAQTLVGTPLYFSPELCEGRDYNAKCDVWALGCLLFELATLVPPFNSTSPVQLFKMIVNDMPPRLPSVYTADFEDLVYRMLDKDADKRPSITQLLELPSVQVRQQMELYYRKASTLPPSVDELSSLKTEVVSKSRELEHVKSALGMATQHATLMEAEMAELKAQLRASEEATRKLNAGMVRMRHEYATERDTLRGDVSNAMEAVKQKDAIVKQVQSSNAKMKRMTADAAARTVALCEWERSLRECHSELAKCVKSLGSLDSHTNTSTMNTSVASNTSEFMASPVRSGGSSVAKALQKRLEHASAALDKATQAANRITSLQQQAQEQQRPHSKREASGSHLSEDSITEKSSVMTETSILDDSKASNRSGRKTIEPIKGTPPRARSSPSRTVGGSGTPIRMPGATPHNTSGMSNVDDKFSPARPQSGLGKVLLTTLTPTPTRTPTPPRYPGLKTPDVSGDVSVGSASNNNDIVPTSPPRVRRTPFVQHPQPQPHQAPLQQQQQQQQPSLLQQLPVRTPVSSRAKSHSPRPSPSSDRLSQRSLHDDSLDSGPSVYQPRSKPLGSSPMVTPPPLPVTKPTNHHQQQQQQQQQPKQYSQLHSKSPVVSGNRVSRTPPRTMNAGASPQFPSSPYTRDGSAHKAKVRSKSLYTPVNRGNRTEHKL